LSSVILKKLKNIFKPLGKVHTSELWTVLSTCSGEFPPSKHNARVIDPEITHDFMITNPSEERQGCGEWSMEGRRGLPFVRF